MPRCALAAFPGFAGLAKLTGRWGTVALIGVSAVAQAVLVVASFNTHPRLPP